MSWPNNTTSPKQAFYLSAPVKNRDVYVGDSITAFCLETYSTGSPAYNLTQYTNRSWINHKTSVLQNSANVLNIAGISGQRIDQMVARFATDVVPYNPTRVFLEGGSNDLDQGYSAQQCFANIMAYYKLCQAQKCILVYVGTAPQTRSSSGFASPIDGIQYRESQEVGELYKLAQRAAKALPGFLHVDMAQDGRDYTTTVAGVAQSVVLSGVSSDGTHPTPYGSWLMGEALAAWEFGLMGGSVPDYAAIGNDSTAGPDGDPTLWNTNPLFSFTSGGLVSAPNTGTLPDNYQVTSQVASPGMVAACSIAARSDGGPGRSVLLAISGALNSGGAGNPDYIQMQRIQSLPTYTNYSNFADGTHSVVMRASAKLTDLPMAGYVSKVVLDLQLTNSSSQIIARAKAGDFQSTKANEDYVGLTGCVDFGLMETPPILIPTTCTGMTANLKVYSSTGAVFTIEIDTFQVQIDDFTAVLAPYF